MRWGCIDIGSNTTRLLVVEQSAGAFTPLLQVRAFTRLGRVCAAGGRIPEATVLALAEVVAAQAATARANGVGAGALRVV
ncbi:MAG: Ppx/GppA phosphatase, partial [Conexibacter sp.]|nr:Ppx/GppA phosphatase [Conexibacter sp.]